MPFTVSSFTTIGRGVGEIESSASRFVQYVNLCALWAPINAIDMDPEIPC